ncbi:Fur-regulated basic protein FbpA [Niallia sp. Krafla_26]|uniref:Fur-regulated basic protein FbpA n=1 Tax=Niallia sp. Krafla_26 TaxID=3064703 RepID=UPI003D185892
MRNSIEKRRQKLINKLIAFNMYKEEDQKLYQSSLSKLEFEYRKFQAQYHPHGEFSSIQWS